MDKTKLITCITVFCAVILIGRLNAQTDCSSKVDRLYIKDSVIPVKGQALQLNCNVNNFKDSSTITLRKSDLPAKEAITQCTTSFCTNVQYKWKQSYTVSSDNSGVYLQIKSLNRSEDENTWICTNPCGERKSLQFAVYTVPRLLKFDNPPSQDEDLVQNTVTVKCSTGCAYPQPSFTWFYNETGDSRQEWSTSGSVSNIAGKCTDFERIYTSTLSLPRYTTLQDNADKTLKFSCGITSFPGLTQSLYTSSYINVRFAVRVTNIALRDGTSAPSDPLSVGNGTSKTLTCITSISRPKATVVWYIGTAEKQRSSTSSSFTFIPQNNDHYKQIFCKAFNLQPEKDAVSSNKATLYILVRVTSVILKDGSSFPTEPIEVTSGVIKTLTCTASTSRPAATISWYIGAVLKQTSYSSTFTFSPRDSDHRKKIFCKENNTKAENEAVSSNKFTLYVKVYATTPTITGYTTENRVVFENDTLILECISSITRPVALVTWKKGSNNLTNIVNTVTNYTRDLASIKSTVTVTLTRNDKHITCETSIPGQENKAYARQGITVYWPPSTPSIPTTNLPFLEGQRGKSIYCQFNEYGNPTATALWSSKYGTPDSSDSRQLNLPILSFKQDGIPASCLLKNQFTETKSIVIQSPSIKIAVEYSPVVNIIEGNNEIRTTTKTEGQRISLLCNAIGNPEPTVSWNGQIPYDKYLRFDDLDRTDNGTYTCKASAISISYPQHNFKTEKKLDVVVNYAPDVTVELSNTDPEEGTSLFISCKAIGQPTTYTYTSMYQTWGSVNIRNRHLPVNGIIDIRNLKIEDSGTYTCLVNNGIADRNNKLDQSGNVTVIIKASPKVLLEDTTSAGAIGKSVNISAPFYSYPDIRNVEFRFQNGTQITNSSKYGVSYKKKAVKYSFYGKPVELEGYIAVLQVMDEEETDFMNYTLILDNGIGSTTHWTLKHISESEPSVPKFFNYTGLVNDVPTFLLKGGFNGGLVQTFVIETAIAGTEKWVEQLRFNENDKNFLQKEKLMFMFNITGLGPDSYNIRVRVGNYKGWIADDIAPNISFKIPQVSVGARPSPSVVITVGITFGAVSFVIVIVVVVVLIRTLKSSEDEKKNSDERSPYESLHTISDVQNVYSSVSSFTDNQEPTDDITYENLKIQAGTKTSAI